MSENAMAGLATAETEAGGGDEIEREGDSVAMATAAALAELGATADEVVVEVLSEGAHAVPGESLTATRARVRVGRIDARVVRGRLLLQELLERMNLPTTVTVRRAAGSRKPGSPRPPFVLDVSGDDLGLLIGWRGETLRALQTVLILMLDDRREGAASEEPEGRRLIVDVERYRARREEQVRELAVRLAIRVRESGERYTMDPMHSYERRIVHLALEDDPGVRTESAGKEPTRRVIINATGPAEDSGQPPRRQGWHTH